MAIHLSAIISIGELAFIVYEFSEEMISGYFNMGVLTWMFISFFRVLGWL